MTTAVVFAYHNVGVQCLSVLLAHKIDVALVVTHLDNPAEKIWFESVAKLADAHGVPAITPDDPNQPETIERIRSLKPDFLFSFYYRHMLAPALLTIPKRGALNMHGSLLPKYRGRVPVNWAVINGERETGATLHYMLEKPDAGDIVAQQAVPILPNETAADVFMKVTGAAAGVLDKAMPALVAGTAPRIAQDLRSGSYFGGRKPADGRIDWRLPALSVHNLVRGVAPPYPGAFTAINGATLRILRTRLAGTGSSPSRQPQLYVKGAACYATCGDGKTVEIIEMDLDGKPITAAELTARFGSDPINLETAPQ
ncbi:MAG: Bifunctional polymyxin resistance protein ArnA [Betaproteobacteria bacterium]|nr:Bifunctional polymyxin resistance protein ArnA [Betaproteobacteria bacterium]